MNTHTSSAQIKLCDAGAGPPAMEPDPADGREEAAGMCICMGPS